MINGVRYAVKHKAPSFVEKHSGKKIEHIEISLRKLRIKDIQVDNEKIANYITSSRLDAVYSKRGTPTEKTNLSTVARELVVDIAQDYAEDEGVEFKDARICVFKYFKEINQFVINEFEKTR